MDNHEIGKNIVQLRKKHGLSQRELAERAGITHSAISSIENGKVSPSVSSLQKIVNVFSLSLSEFFIFEQSSNDEVKVVFKPSDLVEIGSETVSMKLVTNGDKDQVIGFLIEEYAPHGTTGAAEIKTRRRRGRHDFRGRNHSRVQRPLLRPHSRRVVHY